MNWDAIGAVGEAVGAAGVIISLLYLAVQIRGDARAKRAATTHEQALASSEVFKTVATTPDLADLYLRGIRDFTSLQGSEEARFRALMAQMFRLFEDEFFNWTDGHLDARVWRGFEAPISDFTTLPGVQGWWKTRSHWFSDEFQTFIEKKIAEGREPTMYGEATD